MCLSVSSKSSGSTLIVVLFMIAALTLLGMLAIHTATVELAIARNHRDLRQAFYLAEAAAMEGVQRMLNSSAIDLIECHPFWLHSIEDLEQGPFDFSNPEHWQTSDPQQANALQSPLDPSAYIAASESRVAGGGSLIVTSSRLYVNRVYGFCNKYNADHLVQVGYYMRY